MEKRTVWFVYSGMGSQWAGMGAELMRIPIFAETIERLHAVLETKGVDLKTVITETGPQAFDNILKSFVGITACQIALTNVLTALGVVPDGVVGHSLGEQACAYADGALTEEQTILVAWARGVASNDVKLIKGTMAAVGLGYKDVLPRLPPAIDVACHNSSTSCTLSGPAEDVEHFVKELSDEGVFAKAVNVSDIAYHSRYIQPAGPFLRRRLDQIITDPKRRSSKWVTTSVPPEKRDSDWARYCSVDYLTNNLLSPVLLEGALQHIPQQAMLVEIAPHGQLQAILKRALPDPTHIALTQRNHGDPVRLLLSAIGKLSFGSAAPNVAALYPDVEFPVPRGTASLASLATWHVDDSFADDQFTDINESVPPYMEINYDTPHMKANGHRLLPLSEKLVLMWLGVAEEKKKRIDSFPVSLRDVHLDHWKFLPSKDVEVLRSLYMRGLAQVEIVDDCDMLVAHGRAYGMAVGEQPKPLPAMRSPVEEAITVPKEELYQELARHGLEYATKYQNINSIRMTEEDWVVSATHNGHWSGVLESVLQVFLLYKAVDETQDVHLPRTIQCLDVDPSKIKKHSEFVVRLNLASGILVGEGVYCSGFTTAQCRGELSNDASLSTLQFVPFGESSYKTAADFLRVAVGGLLGAAGKAPLRLMQLQNGRKTEDLAKALAAATGTSDAGVQLRLDTAAPPGAQDCGVSLLVTGPATLPEAEGCLAAAKADALLVWSDQRLTAGRGLCVLAEQRFGDDWVSVARRAAPVTGDGAVVVQLGPSPTTPADMALGTADHVVLVWRGLDEAGVHAAIAEVEARPYASRARMVFTSDKAPAFSLSDPLYADQLSRGARVNVLAEDGSWGCWRTPPRPRPLSAALSASSLDNIQLEFLGANPLDNTTGLSGHMDYVGVESSAASGRGRRVMGVAQWLADHRRPRPDPLLRWPVPEGWAAEDAATVPYVYALVYYSLRVKAQAQRGESILVHEGTLALGQAAIRVASQLGCSPIYTTVRDAAQRETLRRIFPQLEPCHVLTCGDGGSFDYRLRMLTRGRGVSLVVNTLADSELRASVRCLAPWGRLLHYNREDMLAARTVGSHVFLSSVTLFGFSGHDLFRGCERDRAEVAEAMSEGLRDGVVQPIVGAKVYDASLGVAGCESGARTVIRVNGASASSKQECQPDKSYLVVSKEAGDALLVAATLATLGARHIVAAVGSPPNTAVVEQRQRTLRRQHAAHLHVEHVPRWDAAAARRLVDGVADLHTAVVVSKDDANADVPGVLADALCALPAVRLVVLSERARAPAVGLLAGRSTACMAAPLAPAVGLLAGRSTACMAAPLATAVGHLADLLSSASPGVTVLAAASAARGASSVAADQAIASLPRAPSDLVEVGRAVARCADGPCLRELPSLSAPARCPRENRPLFALPPLGVLDLASRGQIAGLAARLMNPVFVVESVVRDSIERTAQDVVKLILDRQPSGPYNVLGWRLSTVLALAVQRQLEAAGRQGVLFLVHGDARAVMECAGARPAAQCVASALADAARGPATGGGSGMQMTELDAKRGADAVGRLLDAIVSHESDLKRPFAWSAHVVRASVDDRQSLDENDPNVHVLRVTEPGLDNRAIASHVNENGACHGLAGYGDMRVSIASNTPARTNDQ